MAEQDLLQSLIDGHEKAYHSIFQSHYSKLVAFAFQTIKDGEQAKDIVQNCFVKIYNRRSSLAQVSNINAYLYKIVYNETLNYIRTQNNYQRHKQFYLEESKDESLFDEQVELTEKEHRLYQAIEQLPDQCRRIFVMSRFHEKKNGEIADELGLSIRTVETHISNALKILKRLLLLLAILISK
jgi:RNA polymerase sigma-70 factor, ECF subfamily